MGRTRKIPLRLCTGCREKKTKKELIRVVRTPDDQIEIDSTGKKSGRGVYICPQRDCLQKAIKGKRLEKNLKRHIPPEIIDKLHASLDDLV